MSSNLNLEFQKVATANQVATFISITDLRKSLSGTMIFSDRDEIFFEITSGKYVYVFKYGIIGTFNLTEDEIKEQIELIQPFSEGVLENFLTEQISVHLYQKFTKVSSDSIILEEADPDFIQLIVLNISQSVALDRYSEIVDFLLEDTNKHTSYLENKGKLDIGGNKLKRYIGKVLNLKNKASENLYIFDAPDLVWDNQTLDKFDKELKRSFDLKDRYRNLQYRLNIIKENLELFKDIMDHQESSKLEWIIIILILVEVFDLFIAKLL